MTYNDLSDRPIVVRDSEYDFGYDEKMDEIRENEEDDMLSREEKIKMEEERLQIELEEEQKRQEELAEERVNPDLIFKILLIQQDSFISFQEEECAEDDDGIFKQFNKKKERKMKGGKDPSKRFKTYCQF